MEKDSISRNEGTVVAKVSFYLQLEKASDVESLKRLTHHIEELLDLDSWPEIISVSGVDIEDIASVLKFDTVPEVVAGNTIYVPSEIVRSAVPYKVTKIYEDNGNRMIEAELEDSDKITFDPVIQIPAAEIGRTAFLDMNEAIHTLTSYQEYAESVNPKRVPATRLPEGWTWEMYDDGSGCLKSPEKVRFYEYDRSTREYRISSDTPWIYDPDRFNNLQDFKSWAESRILPLI